MFIFLIVAMVSQGKRQNIKFYTLNMYGICIMIFISYSSVRLFKMLRVIVEGSFEHRGSIFK